MHLGSPAVPLARPDDRSGQIALAQPGAYQLQPFAEAEIFHRGQGARLYRADEAIEIGEDEKVDDDAEQPSLRRERMVLSQPRQLQACRLGGKRDYRALSEADDPVTAATDLADVAACAKILLTGPGSRIVGPRLHDLAPNAAHRTDQPVEMALGGAVHVDRMRVGGIAQSGKCQRFCTPIHDRSDRGGYELGLRKHHDATFREIVRDATA